VYSSISYFWILNFANECYSFGLSILSYSIPIREKVIPQEYELLHIR